MIGVTTARRRSGLLGAFAAKNPAGKVLGLALSVMIFVGCWQWARHLAGPVGWADKGLYLRTAKDAFIDPMLRGLPFVQVGPTETYPVICEDAIGWPLYTNEARAAGRPWKVRTIPANPKLLHAYLKLNVYAGRFWIEMLPIWLLWPILLVVNLVGGQIVDMIRLRQARQSGVYLRGNRMVDGSEWNARANRL